jgi:hypothetical protein
MKNRVLHKTSIEWTRLFKLTVVTIFLTGALGMNVNARPAVTTVDYEELTLKELIAAYKEAYTEAGFQYKPPTMSGRRAMSKGVTRLVFEFPIVQFPHKKRGVASFVITSRYSEGQKCMPCSIHRETFGVPYSDYSSAEIEIAQPKMISADAIAGAKIKAKLGKSFPGLQNMATKN